MGLLLSAVVPVVEVVAAMRLISVLPSHEPFRLMLHHNALLKFSIIVFARVSPVHRDFQGVKLLWFMLLWREYIVRNYIQKQGFHGLKRNTYL